jgi:arginine/lysine/ornithine decarboxylase
MSLYQKLKEYGESDYYPYHMPGHKRNPQAGDMASFYQIDITEIDGFDNLHHPEGMIREAQERAGRFYGGSETYYLVNGSTSGVLASIMTATMPGDEILIARNCHKSVYHAAILQGLKPRYYYPGIIDEYGIYDGADACEIAGLLDRYPDCRAVVITSPTYEGILSDVAAVAEAVHERGKILIVDEAHGAHLKKGAIVAGADLVIHSLHKTLPAMTQTALLHVGGDRVDRRRLRKYLAMLQTSSPSYVMMASMDSCIRYMEEHGDERLAFMERQYEEFMRKVSGCKHVRVGKVTDEEFRDGKRYALAGWDIGKLVISVKNTSMNGQQLYETLRDEYHLQMEMAAGSYVLAMMTVMDTEEGWQRLADAICQIDDKIESGQLLNIWEKETARSKPTAGQPERAEEGLSGQAGAEKPQKPEMRMTPAEAFHQAQEEIPLSESVGRVMADFIMLYPPGIPLLVPGEVMSEEIRCKIEDSVRIGLQVHGVTEDAKVTVLDEQAVNMAL